MKLTAETKSIQQAVLQAFQGTADTPIVPITGAIYFRANKERCGVYATDLQFIVKTMFKCEADGDFTFGVDAKKFTGILLKIKSETVDIFVNKLKESQSYQVILKARKGRQKFIIPYYDPAEYELPHDDFSNEITLSSDEFLGAILNCSSVMIRRDDLRPAMISVTMKHEGDILHLYGANPYSLNHQQLKVTGDQIGTILISPDIINILKPDKGQITISHSTNRVKFKMAGVEVQMMKINEDPPNMQKIIDMAQKEKYITVKHEDLLDTVKRLNNFYGQHKFPMITFNINETLTLESSDYLDSASGSEILDFVNKDVDKVQVSFNGRNLLTMLLILKCEKLDLYIESNNKPMYVSSDESNCELVISPLKP